jgi:hypothetical protein
MMTRNFLVRAGLLVAALLAASPLGVYAQKTGTTTPLIVNIYTPVVDEQNTTAYYNNDRQFCQGDVLPTDVPARFTGDLAAVPGPTSVYGFGAPWTPFPSVTSDSYVDGANCGPGGCLRVQFDANNKVLSLDTRVSQLSPAVPRKLSVDFLERQPDATTVPFSFVREPMLLNVMLGSPFTSMLPCTSRACPEAKAAFAKLWFTVPNDPSTTWRVDWLYLRVLRMSQNTWYFLADSCDGSKIAGLTKLIGARTKPKEIGNGHYWIPFFIEAKLKN